MKWRSESPCSMGDMLAKFSMTMAISAGWSRFLDLAGGVF